MKTSTEKEPDATVETASIATLVAGWMSATGSRIGITTELAFAEARLAALSLTLMVLLGLMSAVFLLGAWGLVVAGIVAVLANAGIPLWITLVALGLLHTLGAWLLWRGAVRLGRYLEFPATRRQFQRRQEVAREMDTAKRDR